MALLLKDSSSSKSSKSANNNNMKKGGTNSFFMCLRPAVVEPDHYGGSRRREPPVLTYVAGATTAAVPKNGRAVALEHKVLPTNDMSMVEEEDHEEEGGGSGDFPGKKIGGNRRFSRVWKAVFFEASMARRIKKGKSDKKSRKSLSVESARYNYQERSNEDDFDFGHKIITRSVSALATSSTASAAASINSLCPTCSSSLRTIKTASFSQNASRSKKTAASTITTGHENNVQKNSQRRSHRSYDCGLFFMLLILLVLVLWGRVCAIFCTSTWLFLAPRWMVKDDDDDSSSSPETKSSEFKKKVVLEGLLARERGGFPYQYKVA